LRDNEYPYALQALTYFIKHWRQYKQQTPNELYEIFDELYADYKNNKKLSISEKEARSVLLDLIKKCAIHSEAAR
jgi:hypothetical protein